MSEHSHPVGRGCTVGCPAHGMPTTPPPPPPTGTASPSPVRTSEGGVWVSYYADRSGLKVHPDELTALRTAVADGSQVAFVSFGSDVWEAGR